LPGGGWGWGSVVNYLSLAALEKITAGCYDRRRFLSFRVNSEFVYA